MMDNLQFKHTKSYFKNEISAKVEEIKRTKKILVIGDKTENIRSVRPNSYKIKLVKEVTRFYKKVPSSYVNSINNEAKEISYKMCIGEKIRTLCEKEFLLTVKDQKEDLRSCPSFRLI